MARKTIRVAARIASIFVLLIFAGLIALLALSYVPALEGPRRSVASAVLDDIFRRPVLIKGAVEFSLGSAIALQVAEVEIAPPQWAGDRPPQSIDSAEFSIPLWSILTGQPIMDRLNLEGARIDIGLSETDDSAAPLRGGEKPYRRETARFISHFLKSSLAGDLSIRNVEIHLEDEENGWNEEIEIDRFVMRKSEDGEALDIDIIGSINATPLTVTGFTANPRFQSGPGPLELTGEMPGATTRIAGTLDVTGDVPTAILMIDAEAESLGDLVELFGLDRTIEGHGSLQSKLSGQLDALTATDVLAEAEFGSGNKIHVNGSIANVIDGEGFDLDLHVDLVPAARGADHIASVMDIDVAGFSGRLRGDGDAMHLEGARIFTNIATAELADIGPISVDRITRDERGRLGFLGVHILAGPAEDPFINATGEVTDVLQVKGISLSGNVNAGAADILGFAGPETAALGRLKGRIAISDDDGIPGIEDLTLSISDSELWSLNLSLVVDDFREVDDTQLDIELEIPNLSEIAAAVGVDVDDVGRAAFAGVVKVGAESVGADGSLSLGETILTGHIDGLARNGRPHLSGNISSELLDLGDVRNVRALIAFARQRERRTDAGQFGDDTVDSATIDGGRDLDDITVGMDVRVANIAGGNTAVGGIEGRFSYSDGEAVLAPLSISFLGGTVKGEAHIETLLSPNVIRTKGRIDKLNMSELLKELRAGPLASGSLNASFDLVATGDSMDALFRSASGNLTASLWRGSIGTGLLDLTGLNFPR